MRDRLHPATAVSSDASADEVLTTAADARRFVPGRRQFIIGAAAAALLAACGGDDDTSGDPARGTGTDPDGELSVVRFFGPYFGAGQLARVPFGLADVEGVLPDDATPAKVTVSVKDPSGAEVLAPTEVAKRSEGLPRPYFAFDVMAQAEGFYDLVLDVDGVEVISQFQVVAPDAPGVAGRIGPGDAFPAVVTPTVADPLGLTPLCTREPQCDLHDSSVDTLLTTTPLVVLVATPAFCQTVICGPVLDIMLDEAGSYPGIEFVHLEVYTNPAANQVPPTPDDFAPIIAQVGLSYEPVIYSVDATGTVVDRLDYIFGAEEIREVADRLSA